MVSQVASQGHVVISADSLGSGVSKLRKKLIRPEYRDAHSVTQSASVNLLLEMHASRCDVRAASSPERRWEREKKNRGDSRRHFLYDSAL
jgi:hypothetical protein